MITYLALFLALFAASVFYTNYLQALEHEKASLAAFWSVLVTVMGSVAVVEIIEERYMIIPAAIGSFVGTWLAIKIK